MARVKRGVTSHKRHKKILKLAKGFRGRNKNVFRIALGKVEKALQYMYRDRKNRKRDFRSLWIQRINAAVRSHGLTYSKFINGLKLANVEVNRKILAELAVNNSQSFLSFVEIAKTATPSVEEVKVVKKRVSKKDSQE
jgi:large subunit ribosomal protein L20